MSSAKEISLTNVLGIFMKKFLRVKQPAIYPDQIPNISVFDLNLRFI